MEKKGFTLIELLAVIVILAIIALIATPVILGVIDKAKLGAAKSSVLGYIDAVEKQVALNQLDRTKENIKDGVYDVPMTGVSIKGKGPDSGWLVIEKGQVTNYSMIEDGYIVTKNIEITKGNIPATKPAGGSVAYKTYTINDEPVYFDPVSTDKCDKNSTSTTCYKWRVIETEDNSSKSTITLQMDHNLINTVEWAPSKNTTGPVTALKELNKQTASWTRVEPLTYEYDTKDSRTNYGKMSCINGSCTLNGVAVEGTAKARMITGEEITAITNTKAEDGVVSKTWTLASKSSYYFSRTDIILGTQTSGVGDITSGVGDTSLAWLIENTDNFTESGATANTYGEINHGYWTLSPDCTSNCCAMRVGAEGGFGAAGVFVHYDYYGLRPVITISKSKI